MEEILPALSILDEGTIKLGLIHRNTKVRLASVKELYEKKNISLEELQVLKSDPCAQIREVFVRNFELSNQHLSDEEVKNILVSPKKTNGLGGLGQKQTDKEGEACYKRYLFNKYYAMPEKSLLDITKEHFVFDGTPYFALCSRYFKKHSDTLRKDVDDQFKERYANYLEHVKSTGFPDKYYKDVKDLEGFIRPQLTREGLDVLCKKGDEKDLGRIRENMRSDFVKNSESEIEYMSKHGEWEDLPYIIKAEKRNASSYNLLAINLNELESSIVKAIYSIGKNRLDELLKLDMPSGILTAVIKTCSPSKFLEISDNTLISLLTSEVDKVRKFACLKSIQSFKKSKLEAIFNNYLNDQESRYYNVVYWLDFGVAMPKSTTIEAVNSIFKT